jgi:hypothetical protein
VLALAQVQEGHDGTLLVLGRVAFEDLIDEFHVLLGELERDRGVVARLVAMHGKCIAITLRASRERSALGLGDLVEQLAANPRDSGEELGSHYWQRRRVKRGVEREKDGLRLLR